jgi:hypothetical protein
MRPQDERRRAAITPRPEALLDARRRCGAIYGERRALAGRRGPPHLPLEADDATTRPPPSAHGHPVMSDLRLRARSVTEIVDAALQLYRRDALEYILVTAVAYAPILVAQLMLFGAVGGAVTPATLGTFGPLWIALLVFGFAGYALMVAIVSKFSSEVYLGRAPDLAAIIRAALPKVLPLIGASVLFGIVIMLGVFLFGVGASLLGAAGGVLAFAVALVWGVYAAARFFAVFQVIILEGLSVVASFGRASALSRGRKAHILLTLLLVVVIVMVVAVALFTVASMFSSTMAAGVVQMSYTIIAYPLVGIAQMILYYDLRIKAEGYDIEVMTGALGAAPPAREPTP